MQIKSYFSLIKFGHTIFAVPFALVGFFLAIYTTKQIFSLELLILIILSMIFARSAAMSFNRWLDRDYDKRNPRTNKREIPAGIISAKKALYFTIINVLLFIFVTYFINFTCFLLSPVALFVILGYSYTKRFTWLCHYVLGLGLSLTPINTFLAVAEKFDIEPIILSLAVLFWVSGFDILYSFQDKEFDKKLKLYSIPAFFNTRAGFTIALASHLIAISLLFSIYILLDGGVFHFLGLVLFSILIISQHIFTSIKGLERISLVFLNFNGLAAVLYSIGFIIDLLRV